MSDYVLNIASIAEPYTDVSRARADLAALLRGLAILDADSALLPSLRLDTDPWLQPVVRGGSAIQLTLGELAHGFYGTMDHDLASFFDSLSRSVPADAGIDELTINAILRLTPDGPAVGYEQTFASVIAASTHGMICAALKFVLIGFLRSELWRFDAMGFVCDTETFLFDHVAEPSHGEAIRVRRIAAVRDELTPRSFWSLRTRVFPNLLFGVDVEKQIERFNTILLPLLFRRLAELDARCKLWRESADDAFPEGATEISRETAQTMKRYGNDRRFRGHDGHPRTYEDHMWIDRSHRVHLICHSEIKIVEIGYVGPHLPTMRYPT
jgi:hypothetical protein